MIHAKHNSALLFLVVLCFALTGSLGAPLAVAQTYEAPGDLIPGSGTGLFDETNYLSGMRFPIEEAPAYLNSQVYNPGGSQGGGGGQCAASNYDYPWRDNYCETRSWTMPLCPSGTGHQGVDIRPQSCVDNTHWAVAAENGTISHIGTYSVYLQGVSGIRHRYLHMNVASIQVWVGQTVTKGQRLGRVSNAFGGTPTTIHLHFDMRRNVNPYGQVYIPPYYTLIQAYEDLLGNIPPEEQGCVPGPVAGAENELFKDVLPTNPLLPEMTALYHANITNGCSTVPLLYCPTCETTRYMMVAFLVRAANLDLSNPPATPSFTDVPTSAWYFPHVEAAFAAGITSGCGGGLFCPLAPVTRGMGAVFITNTTGWPLEPATTPPTFTDVPQSAWYFRAVETLSQWCVTNGCGANTFCPDSVLTRAQSAAFIARAFDLEDTNPCVQYCDPAGCTGTTCDDEWTECAGFDDVCDTTGTQTRGCHDLGCTGTIQVQTCGTTDYTETQNCTRNVVCNDAGVPIDAGPQADGAVAGDGSLPPGDANPSGDASPSDPNPSAKGGCSCQTGAQPASCSIPLLLLLTLLGLVFLRRRRRRSAP